MVTAQGLKLKRKREGGRGGVSALEQSWSKWIDQRSDPPGHPRGGAVPLGGARGDVFLIMGAGVRGVSTQSTRAAEGSRRRRRQEAGRRRWRAAAVQAAATSTCEQIQTLAQAQVAGVRMDAVVAVQTARAERDDTVRFG